MASTGPTEAELDAIRLRRAQNDPERLSRIATEARSIQRDLALERGYALDGAQFLLDSDATVEPVWGTANTCLWAKGEPFYIFSSPGVGKSTLMQQLVNARSSLRKPEVLGYPVADDSRRVLYLALDRPRQIVRSWRRTVSEQDREALEQAILVWPKPAPFTVSSDPDKLLPWIRGFGDVGTVIVDSFFNLAPSLSDEEGAANANNAFQSVVADGIELAVLHHDRKREGHERKRVSMDDMYGGRPISGGAGAMAYLDGDSNTGKFEIRWLKAPAGPVNKIDCQIDFTAGEVFERTSHDFF